MPKIQIYKCRKTFCFSEQQIRAFEKLEDYGVNISQFVRLAVKEKIQRDWKVIKEERERIKTPF